MGDKMSTVGERLSSRQKRPLTNEERVKKVQEAVDKVSCEIRKSYEAGEPLFTKAAIRDAHEQLQRAIETGQDARIKGLNGKFYEFSLARNPGDDPGYERYSFVPIVHYNKAQSQVWPYPHEDEQHTACNLHVTYIGRVRDLHLDTLIKASPDSFHDKFSKFFSAARESWEASEQCKSLKARLMSSMLPSSITKIVGLACASMSHADQPQSWDFRSAYQHALILSLRDVIGTKHSTSPPPVCYAQDPAYLDIDKSVLAEHDITVVDDPRGFLEIDESTVVISIGPDVPVKQIVMDIARPAMIVWGRLTDDEVDEKPGLNKDADLPDNATCGGLTDPSSPRVRTEIKNHYDTFDFPEDVEHFGDVVIYLRREIPESKSAQLAP